LIRCFQCDNGFILYRIEIDQVGSASSFNISLRLINGQDAVAARGVINHGADDR
jgi:hypothetical protein